MGQQKSQASPTSLCKPSAEWDFTKEARLVDLLDPKRTLQYSDHGKVSWHVDEDVGGCMRFAGDGGHLRLPPEGVGNLDMGAAGEVTVLALVQRRSLGHDFIAGLWQEMDCDPRRQYALFVDLPVYGGGDQVVGHVSRSGGASPNLPYSRDYAASARRVRPGEWRIVAFRYDGQHATAFLDGIADPRPHFEEVGPPLGERLQYAKNPYYFGEGMYLGPPAEFTVGAVRLSSGIGNAFSGGIARLAVWSRALTDTEIAECAAKWTPPTMPIAIFDWWRKNPAPGRGAGGEDGHKWSLESVGVKQTKGGSTPVRALPSQLVRRAADDDAIVELPLPTAAQRITVEEISNPAHIHLAVRDARGRVDLEQASEPGTWILPSRPSASTLELHFRAGPQVSLGAICFLK